MTQANHGGTRESSEERVPSLHRRGFLCSLGAAAGAAALGLHASTRPAAGARRVREGWPAEDAWEELNRRVGGRLIRPVSPLEACRVDAKGLACETALARMSNPFHLEDQPGATQSAGWLDAWRSEPSPYAVAAENAEDIVHAVNFAREHGVRLVVKGTGHDYLGRSNSPDALLVWTHRMRHTEVHASFVPRGAPPGARGVPAVSVGAGARWLEAYTAASAAGLYVQGGGCTTVGASGGFILGGGFGSFSKRFGTGAGGVLEFEVITADGRVRIVNEHLEPDLFWALRGGGGSTFGIVSRTTMLAHPLPRSSGIVTGQIRAVDDDAYRALIEDFIAAYPSTFNNQHWGEQFRFHQDNRLEVLLTFVDLSAEEAERVFAPLLDGWRAQGRRYEIDLKFRDIPCEQMWDFRWWSGQDSSFVVRDERPGQPEGQFWWAGNQNEVWAFWNAYHSRWVPLSLFQDAPRTLADLFFDATRHRSFIFQINKGLSGQSAESRERDLRTSIHPCVFGAAGLMIVSSMQHGVFPGIDGHGPDVSRGRAERESVEKVAALFRGATPGQGAYANEADFFTRDWKEEFWGDNYPRLLEIKRRYDPDNLYRVHHGVGSDA